MTRKVYKFVKEHHTLEAPILAIKGSDQLGVEPYRRVKLGQNKAKKISATARAFAGMTLILINVPHWQPEIQEALDTLKPGDPGSLTFPAEAAVDLDLCQQLLNNHEIEKLDRSGFMRMLWVKRNPEDPDDYRDAYKMARAAAEYYLHRNWQRIPALLEQHLLSASPNSSPRDEAHPTPEPDTKKRPHLRRPGWTTPSDDSDD
jgi:phage terminase large subunit GpA-like protein